MNWYQNDGSLSFQKRAVDTAANDAACVVADDVDGDSDVDLLSASRRRAALRVPERRRSVAGHGKMRLNCALSCGFC